MVTKEMHRCNLRRRRVRLGHTLIEVMLASFLALTCCLLFAATVPVANRNRGRAEFLSVATSLAQKQLEMAKGLGYAKLDSASLLSAGIIQSSSPVDLKAAGLTQSTAMGFESTTLDAGQMDTAANALPSGRSFIQLSDVDIDFRQINVLVFYRDENGAYREVEVSSLVANI